MALSPKMRLTPIILFVWVLRALVAAADAPPSTRDLLKEFKSAKYSWQQRETAKKLAVLKDKSILGDMLPFLDSPDRQARCNAGLVLAALGDDRGFQAVLAEVQDTSDRPTTMKGDNGTPYPAGQIKQDRYFAVGTLGLIGDRRAVPPLIELLKDKSFNIAAAYSLGRLGDDRAVPALKEMLASGGDRQVDAAFGLAKIGDPAGLPALVAFLKAPRWVARRNAANMLQDVCDKRAAAARVSSLQDDSPDVRNAAAVTKIKASAKSASKPAG